MGGFAKIAGEFPHGVLLMFTLYVAIFSRRKRNFSVEPCFMVALLRKAFRDHYSQHQDNTRTFGTCIIQVIPIHYQKGSWLFSRALQFLANTCRVYGENKWSEWTYLEVISNLMISRV